MRAWTGMMWRYLVNAGKEVLDFIKCGEMRTC